MILDINDIRLLRALGTLGGMPSRDAVVIAFGSTNLRSKSQLATRALKSMELAGLVTRQDERSPIAWIRTEAGTKALEAAP